MVDWGFVLFVVAATVGGVVIGYRVERRVVDAAVIGGLGLVLSLLLGAAVTLAD